MDESNDKFETPRMGETNSKFETPRMGETNNTNFPLVAFNKLKTIPYDDSEYLMKYQKVVKEYMLKYLTARGLLLMFEVGLGKTITASSIAEEFIDMGRNIIVLAPSSLHENMRLNIQKYREVTNSDRTGFKNYHFISMNSSNMIKQFSKIDKHDNVLDKFIDRFTTSSDLNNHLIIIDEAHNLFNSIVNGSKNATKFYDLVMGAKNLKLLFLSGTPVVNSPFELVPCFNMLFGPIEIETIKNTSKKFDPDFRYETLLPEDYDLFMKSFVKKDKSSYGIINKQKLQNRLMGMVSYYGRKYNLDDGNHFPESIVQYIEIPMSIEQHRYYLECREVERAEVNKKKLNSGAALLTRPKSTSASTYRVRSRQVGDAFLPDAKRFSTGGSIRSTMDKINRIKNKKKAGLLIDENDYDYDNEVKTVQHLTGSDEPAPTVFSSEIVADEQSSDNVTPKISGVSIQKDFEGLFNYQQTDFDEISNNLNLYSPKLDFILNKINESEGLSVIYSAFVKHTIFITSKVLEKRGYKYFNIKNGPNNKNTYAIISGSVTPEERDNIIKVFKSKENINGDIIKIVLLSSAGSEGIDFKNVRNMFIFEPHWNYSRIKQIIARAVRYDSHIDLPEDKRVVNSYLLLATDASAKITTYDTTKVLEKAEDDELTTDINIFSKALLNNILIEQFLQCLQEVAVDCSLYQSQCFMCKPTGEKLFELDFNKDILLPSPCQAPTTNKATVEEYNIAGQKYYKDAKDNIYVFDKSLNGYVELEPKHYNKILELIKSLTN